MPALARVGMHPRDAELFEPLRRLGSVQRQRLARWADDHRRLWIERALALGVEGADGIDLVTEELNTNWALHDGRKEVHDAATMAHLADLFDLHHRLVADRHQMLQQQARRKLQAGPQVQQGSGKLI